MENEVKWTITSYAYHNEAMRVVENNFMTERDRRYAEVNVEKEKALKIKETADLTALELARESQVYKDERNDAMREQNLKDNGIYATRDDLALLEKKLVDTLQPLADYISTQKGTVQGSQITMGKIFGVIAATGTIIGIVVVIANMFMK
jgi:hypothetical protein